MVTGAGWKGRGWRCWKEEEKTRLNQRQRHPQQWLAKTRVELGAWRTRRVGSCEQHDARPARQTHEPGAGWIGHERLLARRGRWGQQSQQ